MAGATVTVLVLAAAAMWAASRRGFYAGDCVGGDEELVHPVAGVSRVVCLAEDAVDTGDERGGILVFVLVVVVGGKGKLCDAGANVKHTSTMVGRVERGKRKLVNYRSGAINMIVLVKLLTNFIRLLLLVAVVFVVPADLST